MIAALVIFIITYLFIGLRRILHIHTCRTVLALIVIFLIASTIQIFANGVGVAHGAEAVAANGQPMTVTMTPADPASSPRTFRIVLICDTPESRSNGLQGFRKLKRDEAAVFIFDEPEIATFWMASVTFPIDIIFVGPDSKVTRVYANRKPGSKDLFPSGKPTKWVIETAAGSKIRVGDRASFK